MEEYRSFSVILLIFSVFLMSPVTAVSNTTSHGIPVEEEYKKGYVTPERVAALRDWVSTQPHLPGEHITDLDLVFAFNHSSGCLDDARQKLDHYLTVRTLFTDLFKDRVMSDWWLNNTLSFAPHFVLPMLSRKGYKAEYLSFDGVGENFDLTDLCKYGLMLTDLGQYLNGTCNGCIIIIDLQNYTERHIAKMQPLYIFQQYFYYLESAFLGNTAEVHYINLSEAYCDLEKVLQESMSKSFFKKIYVHKNMKSFDEHYPIEGLPKEAGGKSKSIKEFRDSAFEEFKANQDYFIADRKKTVDERKRPGGPKTLSHITRVIKESLSNHIRPCHYCQ